MSAEQFNPVSSPLQPGVNLIEASAGTGKTYAIAMLVLRFVVERELDIKALLVVTFTKAATEELKSRIRARLTDAKTALDGDLDGLDGNLVDWLQGSELPADLIRQRLNQALLDIDQAGIFTIHGFCQRVLAEHALESGQLFDCELTGDIAALKQACADDFWRRTLYQRSAWDVSILTGDYQSPDSLLDSIDVAAARQPVYPPYADFDALLAELRKQADSAAQVLDSTLTALNSALADGKFTTSYRRMLPEDGSAWLSWLNGQSLIAPDFTPLTRAGLLVGLNGSKFRSSKKNPSPPDEQKAAYLQRCGIDTRAFDCLGETLAQIRLHFRLALLHDLRERLEQTLQQRNLLSFDDLITRLAAALQGDKGRLLADELQRRFQAALIDEFQDTDQNQWHIFSTLFAAPTQYLYLIGDPKQAIYKFRGADIYSYFAAQSQAQRHYTLGQNWRSHPQLVAGINRLFQKQRPFLFEQLDFKPVQAALSTEDGALYRDEEALAPLLLWQLQQYPGKQEYWSAGKAAGIIRDGVAAEIVELLNHPVMIKKKQSEQSLQPRDIAILVRSHSQARDYQQALASVGVPSVLNSKESVLPAERPATCIRCCKPSASPAICRC
nr:UvrD-helicase domain-containing protein [Methylomarinum sp. Ch1-1]MDP4522497.1 UvrD-helicase domain-containing protein [Methylomarinum sp. Ch1-1]